MSDLKDAMNDEMQKLETARDELKLKMKLAKADVRDRWEEVEVKWGRLQGEWKRLVNQSEGPVDDLRSALKALMADIREGYGRMRDALEREA